MIEVVIIPAAVLFFLAVWASAEAATMTKMSNRVTATPEPEVFLPIEERRRWFLF